MVTLIEKLKKEWHVIKGAPFSFTIVCIVAIGAIWGGLNYVYRDKLSDSEKRGQHWKDDADYWKDVAEHPKTTIAQASLSPPPTPSPTPVSSKHSNAIVSSKLSPSPTPSPTPSISIQANGSIPITGGNVLNPTVINNTPPPAHLNFREEVITAMPNADGEKLMKVHISTERAIPGAVIAVLFSDPFELGTNEGVEDRSLKQPTLAGALVTELEWTALKRNGIPVPNSIGVIINMPAAFMPGQDLIVPVRSKADIHVLETMPITIGH